jgi:hypothetical protein
LSLFPSSFHYIHYLLQWPICPFVWSKGFINSFSCMSYDET